METILQKSSLKQRTRKLSLASLCFNVPPTKNSMPLQAAHLEVQPSIEDGIFRGSDFEKHYELKEKLGEGHQSIVKRVVQRNSGRQFAVKIMSGMDDQMIYHTKKQFDLLRNLSISSIIKVYRLYIFDKEGECRLVMEFSQLPELRSTMNDYGRLTEVTAASIIKSILEALECIHGKNICHRDLKPENVLYCPESGEIKLIDFNIASQAEQMISPCGTIMYNAPEMFEGSYTNKIDMWAIGVMAYEMLHGRLPFYHNMKYETINQIRKTNIDSILGEDLSESSKDFLRKCLERNPEDRLTAKEALRQPFIQSINSKSPCSPSTVASTKSFQFNADNDSFCTGDNSIWSPSGMQEPGFLGCSGSAWKSMALLCRNLGFLKISSDY